MARWKHEKQKISYRCFYNDRAFAEIAGFITAYPSGRTVNGLYSRQDIFHMHPIFH